MAMASRWMAAGIAAAKANRPRAEEAPARLNELNRLNRLNEIDRLDEWLRKLRRHRAVTTANASGPQSQSLRAKARPRHRPAQNEFCFSPPFVRNAKNNAA